MCSQDLYHSLRLPDEQHQADHGRTVWRWLDPWRNSVVLFDVNVPLHQRAPLRQCAPLTGPSGLWCAGHRSLSLSGGERAQQGHPHHRKRMALPRSQWIKRWEIDEDMVSRPDVPANSSDIDPDVALAGFGHFGAPWTCHQDMHDAPANRNLIRRMSHISNRSIS